MTTITIQAFNGRSPKTSSRLLQDNFADVAVNCYLERGNLESLKAPEQIQLIDSTQTIFKQTSGLWIGFDAKVDAVKSAVLDDVATTGQHIGHFFVVGDSYPYQMFASGEKAPLGLPRPAQAPTVIATGTGSSEDVQRSTSYCYTYVRSLSDDVLQQESAPSPPSAVLNFLDDQGASISGFSLPDASQLINRIRIYRTVSGLESSEFYFLAEIDITQATYQDDAHDKDVSSDVLRTSIWDAIPDDAKGMIKADNGIYASWRGNELLLSEPFVPYAMPEVYRVTVEDEIVGLGHTDNTIVILTKGRPYLAVGSVPESMQLVHLPIEQSCVSKESIASLAGGVVYASPDGLMMMSTGEQSLATANVFTPQQWRELQPETLIATIHDDRYIAFFRGSNKGFIFSFVRGSIVDIELDDDMQVESLHHSSQDDAIYLGVTSKETSEKFIYKFEGSQEGLPYKWRSRDNFISALLGFTCFRIDGDFVRNKYVRVRIYTREMGRVPVMSIPVTNNRIKRLPQALSSTQFSIEVEAQESVIYEIRLGTGIESLAYGN